MSRINRRVASVTAPTEKKKPTSRKPRKPTSPAEKAQEAKARQKRESKKTAADKKFDKDRAAELASRRGNKSGGSKKSGPKLTPKQRLAKRHASYDERVAAANKKAADTKKRIETKEQLHKKWLGAKQKVDATNLENRYKAATENVNRRLKARLATMKKRKPKLSGGKIVVPKVDAVKPKLVKFKAKKAPAKPKALQGKKRTKSSGSSKPAPKTGGKK